MSSTAYAEHTAFARWIDPRPSLVVMQPDTFCNLDCAAYCYLPLRKKRNRMPVMVAYAVAESLADLGPDEHGRHRVVEVCWHGGEPLAVGVEAMTVTAVGSKQRASFGDCVGVAGAGIRDGFLLLGSGCERRTHTGNQESHHPSRHSASLERNKLFARISLIASESPLGPTFLSR